MLVPPRRIALESGTVKAFIAYALVVIGVPIFIGLQFGSIVIIPISRLLLKSTRLSVASLAYLEAFNGAAAVLAGVLLFYLFGLPLGWPVFIIMAAWITFYFVTYGQSLRVLLSWLTGMLIAWLVASRIF